MSPPITLAFNKQSTGKMQAVSVKLKCVWLCVLINSLFDMALLSFTQFTLRWQGGLWPRKDAACVVRGNHDKPDCLHYKGRSDRYYPPICNTHSNFNLYKPTTAASHTLLYANGVCVCVCVRASKCDTAAVPLALRSLWGHCVFALPASAKRPC